MKTISFRARLLQFIGAISVGAVLMLGGLAVQTNHTPRHTAISAPHAIEVADGSESNGGKGGGKGGAKLTNAA